MSDKDRWNHQGYQELLRQNHETSNQQQNKHYNSVFKRQNFRYNNTNSKQSSSSFQYNQSWKQSRAFEQPYKKHFGNNHHHHHGNHQKRYNRNFNNYSEANHHQQQPYNHQNNFYHHSNSKAIHHNYSKRNKFNQNIDQKQKVQNQEKWSHCNYRHEQQDHHRPRNNQKLQQRLQKEQEKPGIVQGHIGRCDEVCVIVSRAKREQSDSQLREEKDWKFNQKNLQLHQLQRQDSSITTNSTIYDSNEQDFCNKKKFKSQKKFFKKKYNQKLRNKGPKMIQNQEQEQIFQQRNDTFQQNYQRAYDDAQEEQKLYPPQDEEQEIFQQDDSQSVPTQPSPSNQSLFAQISNAPSPVVPIDLPKTAALAPESYIEEQQSLEFNPVILKVKLQTQKGPIDVSIRQLDNLTHIATQICQSYNLNQNLIPAIAYQFEYALQTISCGPYYPNQAVMPSSGNQQQQQQQFQQQQQQSLELSNSINHSQIENNHQDAYLNNQN